MRTKPTGTILNEYISVNEKHLFFLIKKKDRDSLARGGAAAPEAAAPVAAAVAAAAAAAATATL